jgi:prokaryotic ubiquitin-like protein Pup
VAVGRYAARQGPQIQASRSQEIAVSDGGQTRKGGASREEAEEQVETEAKTDDRELLDDVDELLDEIDDVLEENAEEFVKNYVQKGGQ